MQKLRFKLEMSFLLTRQSMLLIKNSISKINFLLKAKIQKALYHKLIKMRTQPAKYFVPNNQENFQNKIKVSYSIPLNMSQSQTTNDFKYRKQKRSLPFLQLLQNHQKNKKSHQINKHGNVLSLKTKIMYHLNRKLYKQLKNRNLK